MGVQDDTELWIWKAVSWLAASIATATSSVLALMYRRYHKDRRYLLELRRKMEEVDEIRAFTEDGRKSLRRLDAMDARMDTMASAIETLVERDETLEHNQNAMQNVLSEIKTDVKWLCKEWQRKT